MLYFPIGLLFLFCGSTILVLFECLSSFPFITSGSVAAASLLASTNVLYWSADRCDSVREVLSTLFILRQSENIGTFVKVIVGIVNQKPIVKTRP